MSRSPIPLSFVDTAWWRMEHPTNLMMITGILTFEDPLSFEEVREIIEERLLKYPQFSRRLQRKGWRWNWVEDPGYDIRNHLTESTLPDNSSYKELVEEISDKMSTPLDYEKPLWHFHLVHNYEGRTAMIGRLHHCIGDGIGLMRLLLSFTDAVPNPGDNAAEIAKERAKQSNMVVTSGAAKATGDHSYSTHRHGFHAVLKRASKLWFGIKMTLKGVFVITKLTFMRPDPKTALKGSLIKKKTAAWSSPVPLQQVKATGKAAGGTINDILLVALSGALRRYFDKIGETSVRKNFRVAVPVNIRPITEEIELGNKFGLVFPTLPIDVISPEDRMSNIQNMMNQFKKSPEAFITWAFLGFIGWAPQFVEDFFIWIVGTKLTGVTTNVPGPRDTIYFNGHKVRNLMFWAPLSGRAGLGISILSYNKKVLLGITTDKGLVPNPQEMVDEFLVELDYLADYYKIEKT